MGLVYSEVIRTFNWGDYAVDILVFTSDLTGHIAFSCGDSHIRCVYYILLIASRTDPSSEIVVLVYVLKGSSSTKRSAVLLLGTSGGGKTAILSTVRGHST